MQASTPHAIERLLASGVAPNHTLLILAAMQNDVARMELLLERGADLNAVDATGASALGYAMANDCVDAMNVLLAAGLDLSDPQQTALPICMAVDARATRALAKAIAEGATVDDPVLLVQAARSHNLEAVQLLLSAGADVNGTWEGGTTPLLHACMTNRDDAIVKFLIDAGAEIDRRDDRGRSPLHFVSGAGKEKFVDVLLAGGADANAMCHVGSVRIPPLMLAVVTGHIGICKSLIQAGASLDNTDSEGNAALHLAAQTGNVDLVHLLLASGASVDLADAQGLTALMLAAKDGQTVVVRSLLVAKASVESTCRHGLTPPHFAVASVVVMEGTIESLLEVGADPSAICNDGVSPLEVAVTRKLPTVVKLLLDAGARPSGPSTHGGSFLMFAVYQGNVRVVAHLLDAGADVRHVDCDGETALHMAAALGNVKMVQLLLEHGADVTHVTATLSTPLMHAAMCGNDAEITLLLRARARLEDVDADGSTALMLAAEHGHVQCVAVLLKAGANPSLLNMTHSPPRLVTPKRNRHAIATLLNSHQ